MARRVSTPLVILVALLAAASAGAAAGGGDIGTPYSEDVPPAGAFPGGSAEADRRALLELRASIDFSGRRLAAPAALFADWRGDASPCAGNKSSWSGVTCGGRASGGCDGRVVALDLGRGDSMFGVLGHPLSMVGLLTELPREIGDLACLRALNLSGHNIAQLPAEAGRLDLVHLDLFRNLLSDATRFEAIGNLSALKTLKLADNHLLDLPASFCGLQSLEVLELQHTNLRRLTVGQGEHNSGGLDLSCLRNLRRLDASSNNLLELPDRVGRLTSLTELILDDTEIDRLPPSFVHLTNLTSLSLCNTGPVSLPAGFSRLLRGQTDASFRCICPTGTYETWMGRIECFDRSEVFSLSAEAEVEAEAGSDELCAPCPGCLDCSAQGVTTLQLGWALREHDPPRVDRRDGMVAVFQCADGVACLGGAPHTSCANGTAGPLCSECAADFSRGSDGICTPCSDGTGIQANRRLAVWVLVVSFALLVLRDRAAALQEYSAEAELLEHRWILLPCLATAVCCGSRGAHVLEALERGQVLEHTKIVVGLFQVLAPMGDILSLPFDSRLPVIARIFHLADVLFVDVEDYVRLSCIEEWRELGQPNQFYLEWCIKVFATPLMFLSLIFLYYVKSGNGKASLNWFYLLLFLLYPKISEVCTHAICHKQLCFWS